MEKSIYQVTLFKRTYKTTKAIPIFFTSSRIRNTCLFLNMYYDVLLFKHGIHCCNTNIALVPVPSDLLSVFFVGLGILNWNLYPFHDTDFSPSVLYDKEGERRTKNIMAKGGKRIKWLKEIKRLNGQNLSRLLRKISFLVQIEKYKTIIPYLKKF